MPNKKIPIGPKTSKCKCGREYPYEENTHMCPICTEQKMQKIKSNLYTEGRL